MARLKYLMYCETTHDNILPDGNKKLIITQPLTSIDLMFLPSFYSFSIVMGLDDLPKDAHVQVKFHNMELKKIILDTGAIPVSDIIPLERLIYGELNVSMNIEKILFETEGTYVSEVFTDNELVGTSEIKARKDICVVKP